MSFTFTATVGMVAQTARATFHEALQDLIDGVLEQSVLTEIFLEETCWISLGGYDGKAEMILKFYGCRDFGFKVGLLRINRPTKVLHEVGDPPTILLGQLFIVSMQHGGDPQSFIANITYPLAA